MGWKPKGEIAVICFTREGAKCCRRILDGLKEDGIFCKGYGKGSFLSMPLGADAPSISDERRETLAAGTEPLTAVTESLTEWTGKQFKTADGLIFVGAAGIAVRAAAPWIRDKFLDPALVVVDEKGTFAIPVLSGHMGGANDLARRIGRRLGAVPAITTATDIQGLPAIDVMARELGLWISDREAAKQVSAELLEGRSVGFFSDFTVKGELPKGYLPGCRCRRDVAVTVYDRPGCLCLVPKVLTLGIGCRRGILFQRLKEQVLDCLAENHLFPQAVRQVASIDIKEKEEALSQLCKEMGWAFCCFSAEELKELKGSFSHSDFVEKTVGVGNVCERAAVLGSKGELILKKERLEGVTLAAAVSDWQVILDPGQKEEAGAGIRPCSGGSTPGAQV